MSSTWIGDYKTPVRVWYCGWFLPVDEGVHGNLSPPTDYREMQWCMVISLHPQTIYREMRMCTVTSLHPQTIDGWFLQVDEGVMLTSL